MAEYIFYTTEGFTQAPDGNDVENCQLLGCVFGDSSRHALENLLKENPWIKERKYDPDRIFCKEVVPSEHQE